MKNLTIYASVYLLLHLIYPMNVFAGNESGGGGGDAQEARVNIIRADILKWIEDGGAKNLKLFMSFEKYEEGMKKYLEKKTVILGFVEKDHESDPELQVSVEGVPKTCRGFFSRIDARPHMICNISRFEKTTPEDQYRLIHHEYAGLANLEQNDGAASDYEISNQITTFLAPELVLRLSVRPKKMTTESLSLYGAYELNKDPTNRGKCPQKMLISKNPGPKPKVITFEEIGEKENSIIFGGSFFKGKRVYLNLGNIERAFDSDQQCQGSSWLDTLGGCDVKVSVRTNHNYTDVDEKKTTIRMTITEYHHSAKPFWRAVIPPLKEATHHLELHFDRHTGLLQFTIITNSYGWTNIQECSMQKNF